METHLSRNIMSREMCRERDVRIGSDVLMVGRLRYLEGRVTNKPAIRFGNVSMMPDEPIRKEDLNNDQYSFVVEMRSIGWFSGSPVWVYKPGESWPAMLLGVDWGHLFERTKSVARENANMACVAPAWHILDLIYSAREVELRRVLYDNMPKPKDSEPMADTDSIKPGPEPERLALEGDMEDVAKRVMDAGKPTDSEDSGE